MRTAAAYGRTSRDRSTAPAGCRGGITLAPSQSPMAVRFSATRAAPVRRSLAMGAVQPLTSSKSTPRTGAEREALWLHQLQ